jgi:hypothetical protein
MNCLLPQNWLVVRGLPPYRRGIAEAVILMLGLSLLAWIVCAALDIRANAQTLRTLAQIGATLLVAYGVLAASIISAAQAEAPDKRKERLGALVGIGGAGLIGIAGALILSQRAWVTNPGCLEELAFGWTIGSLLMFLLFVALQADAVDSWADSTPHARRSRWLTRNRRRFD